MAGRRYEIDGGFPSSVRPPFDLRTRGTVPGTYAWVIVETRPWTEAVRNETRKRVEDCLQMVVQGAIPEDRNVREIVVECGSPPDAVTKAFFDSLRTFLREYRI